MFAVFDIFLFFFILTYIRQLVCFFLIFAYIAFPVLFVAYYTPLAYIILAYCRMSHSKSHHRHVGICTITCE